jgi:hypothetical protein
VNEGSNRWCDDTGRDDEDDRDSDADGIVAGIGNGSTTAVEDEGDGVAEGAGGGKSGCGAGNFAQPPSSSPFTARIQGRPMPSIVPPSQMISNGSLTPK